MFIPSNIRETASTFDFDLDIFNIVKGYVRLLGIFITICFNNEIKFFLIIGLAILIPDNNCGITKAQFSKEIEFIPAVIILLISFSAPT